MADNVVVSNAPASSNTDIPVRTTETAGGKHLQHMRLDLGSGSTESTVSGSVPISDNGGSITVDASSLPLPTGAATAANQLPDGHNVTVDNGSGAAAVNIQDGGNSITIDASSLPLPTGAATEATLSTLNGKVTACDTGAVTIAAMPNEGQQTMANSISVAIASNQSAVPVSDNGTTLSVDDGAGSLTVDGTIAATQSGTWNVNNISGTVSLPTGAATSANQSTEITSLQLIDDLVLAEDAVHASGAAGILALSRRADTASSSAGTDGDYATLNTDGNGRLHVADTRTGSNSQQIQGAVAAGAAVSGSNPVTIAFKDIFGNSVIPTGLDAGGVIVMGSLLIDGALNLIDIAPDGSLYVRAGSTDGTVANAQFPQLNSSRQAEVDLRRGQTILFAEINASSSGDNTLVAADATKKIKVLSYLFVSAGTVNARLKSGAGTNLSGAMPLIANVGAGLGPATPAGGHLMETAANQALVLNLSGAVQVSGHLSYFLEA